MSKIKVCDAIMGSGKSSAAIRYMNEHPENRYIYITPYKSEADRIKEKCPELNFVRPKHHVAEFTTELVEEKKNIATTHEAFKLYTNELKELIRENEYVLIVDECIELLEELTLSAGDLEECIRSGRVSVDNGVVRLIDDSYNGTIQQLKKFYATMRCRDLMCFTGDDSRILYYWILPADLLTAFKDVYILTYMFEGQELSNMLKMYGIEYQYVYIQRDDSGYMFTEDESVKYIPEYARSLKDKIHILDNEKMNAIGQTETALSLSWYRNPANENLVTQMKKNVVNFMNNMNKDESNSGNRMWSGFMETKSKLKGQGYAKSFVPFNARATNEYADKKYLAYVVNIYMNVSRKIYFMQNGIDVDEDMFALSAMVQWIWRSAIRNGEDICLYVPSSRMRRLLITWMDSLATGGVTCE